jgi:hypothetical protein
MLIGLRLRGAIAAMMGQCSPIALKHSTAENKPHFTHCSGKRAIATVLPTHNDSLRQHRENLRRSLPRRILAMFPVWLLLWGAGEHPWPGAGAAYVCKRLHKTLEYRGQNKGFGGQTRNLVDFHRGTPPCKPVNQKHGIRPSQIRDSKR